MIDFIFTKQEIAYAELDVFNFVYHLGEYKDGRICQFINEFFREDYDLARSKLYSKKLIGDAYNLTPVIKGRWKAFRINQKCSN